MASTSRKALRRESRRAKNERKAENYQRLKKEAKMRVKARYILAHRSKGQAQGLVSNAASEPSVRASKGAEPSNMVDRRRRTKPIPDHDLEMEDPLLAFADRALEEGILGSDGEFDKEAMNSLFAASEPETSSTSTGEEQSAGEDDDDGDATIQQPGQTPPSLGCAPRDTDCPDSSKLQRLTQGYLNRLAVGNFESIALSMAREAETHGRTQFMETFAASLCGSLSTDANLLDSYILNYAALTAALVYCVGTDLVGCVLEELVAELDRRRRRLRESPAAALQEASPLRGFMNVITALSFLYDLQLISTTVILELLGECIEGIECEHEVEGLVRLIRLCGAQLRRDDPAALRRIIGLIQERAQHLSLPSQSSRFKFMLDVVQDLKNNRQKLVAIQRGDMEVVKKLLKSLQQTRGSSKLDPLNVSLGDIREAKSRGKWWRIGAAWKGREGLEAVQTSPEDGDKDTRLSAIAKEQHMNTAVRRAIFGALMTSEDCLDAFRRLLALRLSSRQEQELVHVILHCLCREQTYNPYYVLVAAKFIDTRHNFEVSFKYALWDRLALLQGDELGSRSIAHLASFYGVLLAWKLLPLSALCKVPFAELSGSTLLFLSLLLGALFEHAKTDLDVVVIFEKLDHVPHGEGDEQTLSLRRLELANLRAGLQLFLRQQFAAIARVMDKPWALARMKSVWRIFNE